MSAVWLNGYVLVLINKVTLFRGWLVLACVMSADGKTFWYVSSRSDQLGVVELWGEGFMWLTGAVVCLQ